MKNSRFAICLISLFMQFSGAFAQLIHIGDSAQLVFNEMYAEIQDNNNSSNRKQFNFNTTKLSASTSKLLKQSILDPFAVIRIGMINNKGDTLKPVFDDVLPWSKNKFLVYKVDNNGFWGFVIDEFFKASEAYYRKNGQHVVMKKNEKWGVIRRDLGSFESFELSEAIPFEYEQMKQTIGWRKKTIDGKKTTLLSVSVKENGKWGLVMEDQSFAPFFDFDDITFTGDEVFGSGLLIKYEGQWRIENDEGDYIIPLGYDSIRVVALDKLIVKLGNKWAFSWKDGGSSMWHQTPFEFESFEYGYKCSCARKDGKWGLVANNPKATPITDFEYEDVYGSKWWNVVPLKKNGKWGFYDCKNKKNVTEFIYDEIIKLSRHEWVVTYDGVESTIEL